MMTRPVGVAFVGALDGSISSRDTDSRDVGAGAGGDAPFRHLGRGPAGSWRQPYAYPRTGARRTGPTANPAASEGTAARISLTHRCRKHRIDLDRPPDPGWGLGGCN